MEVTDRVSTGGNAVASVRLSVCLFPLYFSNQPIFGLDLSHVCGSLYYGSQDIETGGHRSRSGVNAVGLTSTVDRGQFTSFLTADIDECSTTSGICSNGHCENFMGGYECICDPGYKPSPLKTSCQGKSQLEFFRSSLIFS